MRSGTLALMALLGFTTLPHVAHAQFLGTSATGSLQFAGVPTNYFDPNNGFVPNGYSNKTQGTTVTVAEPAIEFGFADGANTDTVNITNTTITLTDVATSSAGSNSILVTLTDTAFAGLAFNKVSDTFTGGITFSLVGNTLSLNAPGFSGTGTHTAIFNVAPAVTPEPGSVALLIGLTTTGAGFLSRRRRQQAKNAA